jgi:predicted nucleotide-binding protein
MCPSFYFSIFSIINECQENNVPVDLESAVVKGIIDESQCQSLLDKVKLDLARVAFHGTLLKPDDLLLATDSDGEIVKDSKGNILVVICNVEHILKKQ